LRKIPALRRWEYPGRLTFEPMFVFAAKIPKANPDGDCTSTPGNRGNPRTLNVSNI